MFSHCLKFTVQTYNTILLAIIWIGVVVGLGSQISIASRTIIQVVLIVFGSLLIQTLLLLPKFILILGGTHSLEPDRRVLQLNPSMMELVNVQQGSMTPRGANDGQNIDPNPNSPAALVKLSFHASLKIIQLIADLEKLRSDYDSHCSRYHSAEDTLRKQREKIEDMERELAEKSVELDYWRDQSGASSSLTKVIPR